MLYESQYVKYHCSDSSMNILAVGSAQVTQWVRFFGRIQKRICDLILFGSWYIKGTDESTLRIRFWIFLKKTAPNDSNIQIAFRRS